METRIGGLKTFYGEKIYSYLSKNLFIIRLLNYQIEHYLIQKYKILYSSINNWD